MHGITPTFPSYGKINKNGGGTYQRTIREKQSAVLLYIRKRRDLSNQEEEEISESEITLLVGDQVIFESENQTDGYLLKSCREKSISSPTSPINVDLGIIVTSIVEPAFSYNNLLDRFLVTLEIRVRSEPIILDKRPTCQTRPRKIEEIKQTHTY